MTEHDERAALLAAIAAEPDDDTRRLAYADWLDEREPREVPCLHCSGPPDALRCRRCHGLVKDPREHDSGEDYDATWFCNRTDRCAVCDGTGVVADTEDRDRARVIRACCAGASNTEDVKRTLARYASRWVPKLSHSPPGGHLLLYEFDRGFVGELTVSGYEDVVTPCPVRSEDHTGCPECGGTGVTATEWGLCVGRTFPTVRFVHATSMSPYVIVPAGYQYSVMVYVGDVTPTGMLLNRFGPESGLNGRFDTAGAACDAVSRATARLIRRTTTHTN